MLHPRVSISGKVSRITDACVCHLLVVFLKTSHYRHGKVLRYYCFITWGNKERVWIFNQRESCPFHLFWPKGWVCVRVQVCVCVCMKSYNQQCLTFFLLLLNLQSNLHLSLLLIEPQRTVTVLSHHYLSPCIAAINPELTCLCSFYHSSRAHSVQPSTA